MSQQAGGERRLGGPASRQVRSLFTPENGPARGFPPDPSSIGFDKTPPG